MANKISQIKELIKYLPPKDAQLAEKFLDKRMFVELKEITDSDITSLKNILDAMYLKNKDVVFTKKYIKKDEIYNNLKELQSLISPYAADLEETISDETFYDYYD